MSTCIGAIFIRWRGLQHPRELDDFSREVVVALVAENANWAHAFLASNWLWHDVFYAT
jgi:hypothetical protein